MAPQPACPWLVMHQPATDPDFQFGALIAAPPADLVRLAAVVNGEVVGSVGLPGSEAGRRELGSGVGGRGHETAYPGRPTLSRQFAIRRP